MERACVEEEQMHLGCLSLSALPSMCLKACVSRGAEKRFNTLFYIVVCFLLKASRENARNDKHVRVKQGDYNL